MTTSPAMRNATIWAIRDARELSSYEKLLLLVIESRGELWTSASLTARDMNVSISTYRKTISSLVTKGLVSAEKSWARDGGSRPTRYRVNHDAVAALQRGTGELAADSGAVEGEAGVAAAQAGRGRLSALPGAVKGTPTVRELVVMTRHVGRDRVTTRFDV